MAELEREFVSGLIEKAGHSLFSWSVARRWDRQYSEIYYGNFAPGTKSAFVVRVCVVRRIFFENKYFIGHSDDPIEIPADLGKRLIDTIETCIRNDHKMSQNELLLRKLEKLNNA